MKTISLLSLSALQAASAAIIKRAPSNHGWQRVERAPADAAIKLHIAVRQEDGGQAIEQQLLRASQPDSPFFRQHLNPQQLAELSKPSDETVDTVTSWLREHGLTNIATLPHGICEVDTTIEQAEHLLNATYNRFIDGPGKSILRTEHFQLPDHLAQHIDFVTPTTVFPKAQKKPTPNPSQRLDLRTSDLSKRDMCGATDDSTPTCIRQVYDIDYAAVPNRTTFGIYATEGASATYDSASLQSWLTKYNPPAAAAQASYIISGRGDPANKDGGIAAAFEVALDTETFLGLAWPAQGTYYNRGGVFGPNVGSEYDPFVQFVTELMNNETVPSVVSFSESQPEDLFDRDYALRLCNLMAAAGNRGTTLVFSSGNNGPQGDTPSGEHKAIFEPEFPASCPWVLSVGGTTNLANETGATKSTIPPTAALEFTASGGGFSNLFSSPSWSYTANQNYINAHVPQSYHSASGFNPSGRGIPDVSAFATTNPVVVGAIDFPVGGTSGAVPIWGAIITLLNDYEASKGRPCVGFVNPWLYSLKSGLKDITTGGNNQGSCNLLAGCHLTETLGFDVTVGWDPVTGLGSPIFSELRKALDDPTAAASPP